MSRFEALQAELFSADPAVFPPSIFTPDNFLWAVGTVRSRVHAPLEEDKLAIVPLADAVRLGEAADMCCMVRDWVRDWRRNSLHCLPFKAWEDDGHIDGSYGL